MHDEPAPETAPRLLGLIAWAGLFVLAGFLGRATVVPGDASALVWPAAGVGALWLSRCGRRARPWWGDVVALLAASFSINVGTGAPAQIAAAFTATNVVQAVAFAILLGSYPRREHLISARAITPDLLFVAAASLLSGVVGLLGYVGLVALDVIDPSATGVVQFWVRQASGIFVVGVVGLTLAPATRGAGRLTELRREGSWRVQGRRLGEAAALWLGTLGLYAAVFLVEAGRPFSFVLLVATVWAGVRFGAVVAALHGLVVSVLAVAFTVEDFGPFVAAATPQGRALAAQIFCSILVLLGVLLAVARSQVTNLSQGLLEAERARAREARRVTTMLDTIDDGLLVIDEDGRLLLTNPAGARMMGLPPTSATSAHRRPEDASPITWEGFRDLSGGQIVEEELVYREALRTGAPVQIERRVRLGEGAERRIRITATPFDDPGQASPTVVLTLHDVTADAEHREALASFAGVVAHDLLNPLGVASGWADSLAEELRGESAVAAVQDGVALHMLGRVQQATTRMRDFVTDLLNYTTARDREIHAEPLDLGELARDLVAVRSDPTIPAAERPHFVIGDLPVVRAERVLMRQVIDNLIGNAVKYVAPGVRPEVTVSAAPWSSGFVAVTIGDNGIGVPEAQRQRIFDDFERAHSEDYQGTGLGLAICARTVERHGGRIWVEVNPDTGGSRFVFTLPAASAPNGADADESEPAGESAPGSGPLRSRGLPARRSRSHTP